MLDAQKEQNRLLAGGRPREPAKEGSDGGCGIGCFFFSLLLLFIVSALFAENGVSQQEFDQLMIKADISYEKDMASGSMLDIFRAVGILQKSMNANEIARLFQQFDELANIQGKHPEQEKFIGGLKDQMQLHSA